MQLPLARSQRVIRKRCRKSDRRVGRCLYGLNLGYNPRCKFVLAQFTSEVRANASVGETLLEIKSGNARGGQVDGRI